MTILEKQGRLLALGSLPTVATVVTALVALYMTLVSFGNITDFGTNQPFVQHVLAMDTTTQDPDLMWRAVPNETVQNIAYIGVIIWETVTAIVLLWATLTWIQARKSSTFDPSRRLSTSGFLMVLILFGGGFITIGGEWFAMWQSAQWNGLQPALQNFIIPAFGPVLVHLPFSVLGCIRCVGAGSAVALNASWYPVRTLQMPE